MGIRSGNNFLFHSTFCCHFSFAFFLLEMALSVALLRKQEENVGCVGVVGGVHAGVLEQS